MWPLSNIKQFVQERIAMTRNSICQTVDYNRASCELEIQTHLKTFKFKMVTNVSQTSMRLPVS